MARWRPRGSKAPLPSHESVGHPMREGNRVQVEAYVLIQTEVGKAAEVVRKIREIPGVTLAEDVTGPYDVIVRASASTMDELGRLVASRIQSVPGISRTLTCPVVNL
jgi:DNA-binding Lrp family transcriptional regulator